MSPFNNARPVFVSNTILMQVESGDRRAVVVPDQGFCENDIIIMKSSTDFQHKNEAVNEALYLVVTSVEKGEHLPAGNVLVFFADIQKSIPHSVYKLLSSLSADNHQLRQKLATATASAMRAA